MTRVAAAQAPWEPQRGGHCRGGLGSHVDSNCDIAKALSVDLVTATGSSSQTLSTRSGSSSSVLSVELEPTCTPPDVKGELSIALHWLEEGEVSAGGAMREFLGGLLEKDLLARAILELESLEFEVRKDAARVFDGVVRRCLQIGMISRLVKYLRDRPEVTHSLLDGSGRSELSLQCVRMLKAYSRCEELATLLLEAGAALMLLSLTRHPAFDVAVDAFAALRDLLLGQSKAAGVHLQEHFDDFFKELNGVMVGGDYITQRQALRLLGDILLNADFMGVMLRYVSREHFLKVHMNLLLDGSIPVKVGAFHVFKIFVANPNKPVRIQRILQKNSHKLVRLLRPFSELREDDDHFVEDVASVVGLLVSLAATP